LAGLPSVVIVRPAVDVLRYQIVKPIFIFAAFISSDVLNAFSRVFSKSSTKNRQLTSSDLSVLFCVISGYSHIKRVWYRTCSGAMPGGRRSEQKTKG
jgi:hypothetical protein